MNWWQRLWKRRQLEDRLSAELRDHFDRLVVDDIARGVSSSDAARSARLEFGGIEGIKEECRDARGTRWVHDCAQDLRYAMRALARDPWFTGVTVVSLALGIGVCSMAFTITDAYFFRGLPVDHPERMLHVSTTDGQGRNGGVSFPDYLDWRASLTGVELAAFTTGQMIVKEDGRAPDRLYGAYVSADVFRLLGASAAIGRVFTQDDELPGRTSVVLLGHRLWTDRYDADRSMPGRTILVNGAPATVLGVMPEGFGFPFQQQFWLPLEARPGSKQDRGDRSLDALARIVDGHSTGAAASAWRTVTTRLATAYPDTNADIDVRLVPFAEHQVGRITNSPALLLPVTAVIVLLIACVNVANLLLARASTRTRELGIRASVGATRWRVIRQLLTESLLLAGLGGVAGLGTAILAVKCCV